METIDYSNHDGGINFEIGTAAKTGRGSLKLLFGVFCFFVILTFISFSVFSNNTGPHGGSVKETGKYIIEMKNDVSQIYVYLLDKKLRSLGTKGIACEVRFFFPDSTTVDANLFPYDNEGFSNVAGVSGFSSCRVTLNLSGEKVSALFASEISVVKEE